MSGKPICFDLFCGLGGWTEGFLAEGYECIGFDIERHDYGTGGYPGQLVLQDVRTLHGRQLRDAAVIVASPPCQRYSYMAMSWTRAKKMRQEYLDGTRSIEELNELFNACFRIAKEAGVPLIVENVRGAQEWVGPAQWNYGSFYLWGDVPALMPLSRRAVKVPGLNWSGSDKPGYVARAFNTTAEQSIKNSGGSWFNIAHNTTSGKGNNPDGRKTVGHVNQRDGHKATKDVDLTEYGGDFGWDQTPLRQGNSKSQSRKAASAHIAKIPFPLARHIAQCFKHQGVFA